MADPAPPAPAKKPAGPMRFVLIGCGLLTGLAVLGLGSCAGVMYFIYRSSQPIADVGAAYLRNSPEIQEVVGAPITVRARMTGWRVNVRNDGGDAFFTYDLEGPRGGGYAEATLVKSGGRWTAQGGRFSSAINPRGDIFLGVLRKAD